MSRIERVDDVLIGFFAHGVPRSEKVAGNQYISSCVFCGKKDKLYINIKSLLWDCKVCGRSGNFHKFMEHVSERNQEIITDIDLERLADERGLPVDAFKGLDIGYDGSMYTLPLYDLEGRLVDLKHYTLGSKVFGTKGGRQALINGQALSTDTVNPIIICEGQWDTFAMMWLVKRLDKKAIVVGVPGASILKEEWLENFYQRDVYLCYDNDDAGKKGEAKAFGLIEPLAKSVYCLHWPESKPDGYDLRDFIKFTAVRKQKPKRAYARIFKMMEKVPRLVRNFAVKGNDGELVVANVDEELEPISFEELLNVYRKWLYIPDITPIKVLFATIFANEIPGEMLWMFFVGPPSSLKTELIRSLSMTKRVEMVSTLTPRTLVSGFIAAGAKDVSLLRVLDKRILAIKDYTSVLTTNPIARDEIHGQLRDVYDGQIDKMFGHGQHRRFKVKFGIVAAVTATIEKFGIIQQTLGERFLRYVLPKESDEKAIMEKLKRATSNISFEDEMRTEIGTAVKRYLETAIRKEKTELEMPDEIGLRIHYLSRFTALMRGFVERDYKNNVLYRPDAESPARLSKQLFKLAFGFAIVGARDTVNEDDYTILRDIAIGTAPGRMESIVKRLYLSKRPMKMKEISLQTDFPIETIRTVLNDLIMLKLVKVEGAFYSGYFDISDLCRDLIVKAHLYPQTQPVTKRFTFARPAVQPLQQRASLTTSDSAR